MAKMVERAPILLRKGKGGSKYPWNDWLNGSVWKLVPGVDYHCELSGFRAAACMAAARRGLWVTARQHEGVVYLQAGKV